MVDKILVYYDNNEQLPYTLNPSLFQMEKKYLETGDYTLHGAEGAVCIERKSLDDYVASLQREAFFETVKRMKTFPIRYIIVEGNLSQILDKRYSSDIPASRIIELTSFIMIKEGVPVLLFENRQVAVYFLENLFLEYVKPTKKVSGKAADPKKRKPKAGTSRRGNSKNIL